MSRSRRGHGASKLLALVLVGGSWGGCALNPPGSESGDPAYRAQRAYDALHLDAFTVARNDLQWLAARCEAGAHGRRALLLLAAAELDPQNPRGSPHRAAWAAANYLLLPDAEDEHVPLARTLYRLAIDRGATPADVMATFASDDPPLVAGRFDTCDTRLPVASAGSLPTTPTETSAARMQTLEASVVDLRMEADSLRLHAAELETELKRITALLREGGRALPPVDRR